MLHCQSIGIHMNYKYSQWNELLDEAKATHNISSDAALAKLLGKTRSHISAVRLGDKSLSIETAEKLLEILGLDIDDYVHKMFMPIRSEKNKLKLEPHIQQLKASLLKRSNGVCELCEHSMPFILPNGSPYFELAYIEQGASDDKYQDCNFAALCPNCHRQLDILNKEEDIKKLLAKIK
jgi:transcriptional regulator with XRE-family HTH domain